MSLAALTQAVLLGTARRPAPTVELPEELAGVPAAPGTPEQALLRSAAVLGILRLAGERPARAQRLPEPAPPETRSPCPPAAEEHLRAMLEGPFRAALGEWLRTLATTPWTVPFAALPRLLDEADEDPALQAALDTVLPERARWLAAAHGDWEWALGGAVEERWQTGSRVARRHVLRVLRSHDPAAARELLGSTWEQESGRDREAFLADLTDGLSLDDEPFLEAALDARQQGVRVQAAALLSSLPGSALAQRMAARLEPLVGTKLRKLVVELPGELDDELRRDGLVEKPPSRMGARAWTLQQLVAAAPLETWKRVDAEPRKLLDRRVEDNMADILRPAWVEATRRQRDAAWAAALLERGVAQTSGEQRSLIAIAPAAGEQFLLAMLQHSKPVADALTDALPTPWSRPFTDRVIAWVANAEYAGRWIAALGRHGDPALADSAGELNAAAMLAFRRTMLDTLKEAPTR